MNWRLSSCAQSLVLLWGWRRAAVAVAAGAVSALALPPFDLFPLLWITVPVLVWLLDGADAPPGASLLRRLAAPFAVGWCFGFGYFVGGLWWLGAAFLVDADRFALLMPFAVLALPAGLALFWGLGAALASLLWSDGWPRVVAWAVIMTAMEWLRGHVLTGFPWNAFGYTLMPSPLMMQAASLVGLWGVTLLAFLVFAAPVLLVRWRPRQRGELVAFGIIAALFALDLGFGAARLQSASDASVPGVKIRIVQPVFAQEADFVSASEDEIMRRYLGLSATGMKEGEPPPFTVLVWPETAFPFFLTERPNALAAIGAFLPEGTSLITGAVRAEPGDSEDDDPKIYNSIYAIGSDGVIRDAYDKVHLVPFGEYLPFDGFLSHLGLRQMVALPGGFDAGYSRHTLSVEGAPPAAPLICYEAIFPGAVVDANFHPEWLVNVTNDAWFGATPGPYQHFKQAIVRAVEEGVPLIRSANAGISGIVDSYGRVRAEKPLNSEGVVDGSLPAAAPPTLYAKYGDLLYLLLSLIGGLVASVGHFSAVHRRN